MPLAPFELFGVILTVVLLAVVFRGETWRGNFPKGYCHDISPVRGKWWVMFLGRDWRRVPRRELGLSSTIKGQTHKTCGKSREDKSMPAIVFGRQTLGVMYPVSFVGGEFLAILLMYAPLTNRSNRITARSRLDELKVLSPSN